jgi:hypothetical protein
MSTLEPEILLQLRAKTDRQLLGLIHSKLEDGLNLAVLAETIYSDGNKASAKRALEQGNQALGEVESLLPVLNERQRRGLDPKVSRLRQTLERLEWLCESPQARASAGGW